MQTTEVRSAPSARQARVSIPVTDLYDPLTGRFDTRRLWLALFVRGLTPGEFASLADIGRTTMYKALSGAGLSRPKAMAILMTLGRVPPRLPPIE